MTRKHDERPWSNGKIREKTAENKVRPWNRPKGAPKPPPSEEERS